MRKYGQFQRRFEARPLDGDEPTSPALPTVRPALAAKIDPFASSTPRADSDNPQPSRSASGVGGTSNSRSGKAKMAIFSDSTDDSAVPPATDAATTTKGWESIGSLQDRKKENTIEARPWAGETLKAGKKATGGAPKMAIFKDQVCLSYLIPPLHPTLFSSHPYVYDHRTNPWHLWRSCISDFELVIISNTIKNE